MKKNILVSVVLGLLFAAVSAHAVADTTFDGPVRSPEPAQKVTVVKSSNTTQGISITTQTATNVIVDATQMFSQVCVQNLSTAAYLACSENVNVSTQPASATVGTIIPAAQSAVAPLPPTCFSVVSGSKYYCLSSSVTGSTRAGFTRVR